MYNDEIVTVFHVKSSEDLSLITHGRHAFGVGARYGYSRGAGDAVAYMRDVLHLHEDVIEAFIQHARANNENKWNSEK